MNGCWDWSGWGWHWWWLIGTAVFWILLIIVAVIAFGYLVRKAAPSSTIPKGSAKTALDYLEEVYAKGEIGREEFLQKREDLKRN